ncbi:ribbon-helix-helix protein, CopG family [Halobiforma nitratireducens]|uniref:CopG family transcriptional regulator n=1 Tax=Halobiforma nitratireducens JCM 10879 TaxID=1227454 RepID=M0LJX5_9EURY|nr:ribbon-helix-helix protein, CopG family [Halobiforma nitratireducens]EMA33358.1 CopG family transcriptional regulator [Halobiforma nitratireducens JCM 10879]
MTRRVTVSLDDDSEAALETLLAETGEGQSEVTRRALTFYAANLEAATGNRDASDSDETLARYYRMLSSGEHVLLDVDFLHAFLEHCYAGGDPDPEFVAAADRVADYHGREYADRFASAGELLEWLSFCGFLEVRQEDDGGRECGDERVYHVVFPSQAVRWFMTRFLERSIAGLPTEIDIDRGVSKAIVTERLE